MKVTIIGGGVAGLAIAIALQKKGIPYEIFEASRALQATGAGLGLTANAIKAFKILGIADEVVDAGNVLHSFSIFNNNGKVLSKTDSDALSKKIGINNFTIHRAALQNILLKQVDPALLRLNKRAICYEAGDIGGTVSFSDGSSLKADLLIVADGIHSPIRQQLWPLSNPVFAGYTCWRAVIKNPGIEITETSESWGRKGRFGIVPLADNDIYWFACINGPANSARFKEFTTKDLLHQFKDFHWPIPEILKATPNENLIWNDIIYLKPLKQYVKQNVVLVGDAAHATTPNLGQGACQALEDAVVLADELSKNTETSIALNNYERRRLSRTHAIIQRSGFIGNVAQIENPFLVALRNNLLRMVPSRLNEKQLEDLVKVDF